MVILCLLLMGRRHSCYWQKTEETIQHHLKLVSPLHRVLHDHHARELCLKQNAHQQMILTAV